MFEVPTDPGREGSVRLIEGLQRALDKGSIRPGGRFPTPDRLSTLTGESLTECLKATGKLLEMGLVEQGLNGQLRVTQHGVESKHPLAS